MKILVVHNSELSHFPPVINLVQNLLKNGHIVILMSKDDSGIVNSFFCPNFEYIKLDSSDNYGRVEKVIKYIRRRLYIRKKVKEIMEDCDLIWTTTDTVVREIGKQLFQYKHVMQLMELIEYTPLFQGCPVLRMNIKEYARRAYKVVVPEYNRAHIQKTWWGLSKTPTVLPNKPYTIPKFDENIPESVQIFINQMKCEKRKILLYQGVFYADRNLDIIADAVDQLNDKYCLYIMGRETEYSRKLCGNHPGIVKLPFIIPPYHMCITANADIGLMPYTPGKAFYYSVLNALYCAPNKIFEYAGFGLPMLGADVPGITIPFKSYDMGRTYENTVQSVIRALEEIDEYYNKMKKNSFDYYNSIDLDAIVDSILKG